MTLDEIKKLISEGGIKPSTNELKLGKFKSNNTVLQYRVFHGWDIARAYKADNQWGNFNAELLDYIQNQNYSEADLQKVLDQIQIHDSHWCWFDKHYAFKSEEYNWFFLEVNNITEGICLTYHPKESVFDSSEIFYIEYIAVAPWNRKNPYRDRKLYGLGSILMQTVCEFFLKKYKYKFRFSLHSVEKAKEFYEKVGMTRFSEYDKKDLYFYEMIKPKKYIVKEEMI